MTKARRNFTEEEKQFLIKNFPLLGPSKCGKALNRHRGSIEKIARFLNLKFRIEIPKDKIEFIKNNYHLGPTECAKQTGLTKSTVTGIFSRSKLKLTKAQRGKICTESRLKTNEEMKVGINQFLKIENPYIAYLLGLFWADGYINKHAMIFSNLSPDIGNIKHLFDSTGKWVFKDRKIRERSPSPSTIVRTSNAQLSRLLMEKYKYNKKSFNSPTEILKDIPENLHFYFWRGYCDGDGNISVSKAGRYGFSMAGSFTQDWTDFIFLLDSFKIKYTVVRAKSKQKCGKIYKYSVIKCQNYHGFKTFLEYIYQDCLTDKSKFFGFQRKFNKFFEGLERKKQHQLNLRLRSLPIEVFNYKTGGFIDKYDSIEQAAKKLKISASSIRRFFKNNQAESKGLVFKKALYI